MEMKILAQQLGISHQMANRLKRQGMDCTSLETAKAWRRANIDPFRSKTGRIGGGKTGKKYQPAQVNKIEPAQAEVCSADEVSSVARALREIIPNLWFSQIGWLATALREQGVKVTPKQLIGAQSILFLIYMETVDNFLASESPYTVPLSLMAKPGDEIYPSLIASLNQILSEESMR